jgi:hypothetical protein
MPNYFIGIDPDMHNLSAAVLDDGGRLLGVAHCKVDKQLKKLEALRESAFVAERLASLVWDTLASCPRFLRCSCASASIIVEVPDCRYTASTTHARVEDVALLGAQSGILGGSMLRSLGSLLLRRSGGLSLTYVYPSTWKGQTPKHIHQPRILKKAGIPFEIKGGRKPESKYPVPLNHEGLVAGDRPNKSDWKDFTDSIGLAQYGLARYNASLEASASTTNNGG